MNRIVKITGIVVISLSVIGYFLFTYLMEETKKHSPLEVIEYSDGNTLVEVSYCRPFKKGRLIFGEEADGALQPWGNYWRLGANEATTLKTNQDIKLAGHELKAGIYSFYAFPGKDSWEFGLNNDTGQWGYAEPNYSNDVLRFKVPVEYLSSPVEQFTMMFEEGQLVLRWDTSEVKIDIE